MQRPRLGEKYKYNGDGGMTRQGVFTRGKARREFKNIRTDRTNLVVYVRAMPCYKRQERQ